MASRPAAMYRRRSIVSLPLLVLLISIINLGSVSGGVGREYAALHAVYESFGPNNLNWSATNYCEWERVVCNEDGMVKAIYLTNRNLTGSLSPSITSLLYLEYLDISYNRLTGPFPSLHRLRLLSNVLAQNNNFISFPVDFFSSDLTALSLLNISHNHFSPWNITGHSGELKLLYAVSAGVSGTLDVFTMINFPRLTGLYLADNQITGTVPPEISRLPYLRFLDVSSNQLTGQLPKFRSSVVVTVYGNPDLGTVSIPAHSRTRIQKHSHVFVFLLVSGCVGGLVVFAIITIHYCRTKKKEDPEESLGGGLDKFAVEALRRATGGFADSNLLGEGGFSKVYKGVLENGTQIAVKRMRETAVDDIKAEIHLQSGLRHRNLISLLGYCLEDKEMMLVYEYMPQGTLGRHLFSWQQENLRPLDWHTRLRIAVDIAKGVNYLHTASEEALVHRDLKPSNILLGQDMEAKIADFGLVHPIPNGRSSASMPLAGTQGYWAYESVVNWRVSPKGDVYTFGVILMELLSGRKSITEGQDITEKFLPTWFADNLNVKDGNGKIVQLVDPSRLHTVIDPPILSNETLSAIAVLTELAFNCIHPNHHSRPTMAYVLGELTRLVEGWEPPEPEVPPFDMVGEEEPRLSQIFRAIDDADLDASSSSSL